MKKNFLFISSVFISLFLISSCAYNKIEITPSVDNKSIDSSKITFEANMKFLLKRRCAQGDNGNSSCHFEPNLSSADFSRYSSTTSTYYKDRLVGSVERDPSKPYFKSGTQTMPQGNPKIPQAEIDTFIAWMKNDFKER